MGYKNTSRPRRPTIPRAKCHQEFLLVIHPALPQHSMRFKSAHTTLATTSTGQIQWGAPQMRCKAELKRMRCLRKLILVSRDFGTHGPNNWVSSKKSSVRLAKIWLQDTKWQTTSNHSAAVGSLRVSTYPPLFLTWNVFFWGTVPCFWSNPHLSTHLSASKSFKIQPEIPENHGKSPTLSTKVSPRKHCSMLAPCFPKTHIHPTFQYFQHLAVCQNLVPLFCSHQNSWDLWMFIPLKMVFS